MADSDDDDEDERPRRRRRRRDDDDYDDEDDERPRRRRRRREDSFADHPENLIVPLDVSGWSVAAFFCGIIGCFPILGVPVAIAALVLGIIALKRRKKGSCYGKITGDMRAVIGLILATMSLLLHLAALIVGLAQK